MKNKFIAMLVGIFLIPIACRTETDYVDKEEARQPFAVFSTTSNNNVAYRKNSKTGSDQIDYASGFAYLLQRHDSIHHKNNTGLVNSTNETTWDDELKQRFIKNPNSAFIEFRIKSQIVIQENQDKWVIFPKIENGKVIDLVGVVLSENETDVSYYHIDRESNLYKDNVSLFQEKYNQYFTRSSRNVANRDAPDKDIDEIILSGGKQPNWWNTGKESSKEDTGGSSGGGRCGEYNDCKKDDRGGGGGEKPQDKNPCAKAKVGVNKANTTLADARVKTGFTDKLSNIAKNSTNSETGITIGKNSNGNLKLSDPITVIGTAGQVPAAPAGYNALADGHNHNSSNPPSPGDLWTMMEKLVNEPGFATRYIFGQDGSMYALTTNDRQAAIDFLAAHPRSEYLKPNSGDFIQSGALFDDFYSALSKFENQLPTNNESTAAAMAYIMDKYGMGISLSKNNGTKLQTVNAQKNPDGTYSTSTCN